MNFLFLRISFLNAPLGFCFRGERLLKKLKKHIFIVPFITYSITYYQFLVVTKPWVRRIKTLFE